jgi:hypothetical protein
VTARNTGGLDGDVVVSLYMDEGSTGLGAAGSRPRDGARLLSEQRRLLDFTRLHDVQAGAAATAHFNVTAASLASFAAATGDLVSSAGSFRLTVEDGSGAAVSVNATVTGPDVVLEPFPGR